MITKHPHEKKDYRTTTDNKSDAAQDLRIPLDLDFHKRACDSLCLNNSRLIFTTLKEAMFSPLCVSVCMCASFCS